MVRSKIDQEEEDRLNPAKVVSAASVTHNTEVVNWCRSFVSIFAGCACGILGLTGLAGLLFFFVATIVSNFFLFARLSFNVSSAFKSWSDLALAGVTSGAMSFLLFWILMYNIVHTY